MKITESQTTICTSLQMLKSSAVTEWLKAALFISPGNSDPYLRISVDAGVVPADLGQTA